MKLKRDFFERDTLTVAKELLGKVLVRKIGKKEIRAIIVETEAYIGEKDLACHARFGKTKRTEVMYGKAGCAYIYLCYGIHELLNIVTERENFPTAVLIRRVMSLDCDGLLSNLSSTKIDSLRSTCVRRLRLGLGSQSGQRTKVKSETAIDDLALTHKLNRQLNLNPNQKQIFGPGKLTKYLHITRELNKEDLIKSAKLWVESDGLKIKKSQIKSAKRIGISYAGKWAKKKWRFSIDL